MYLQACSGRKKDCLATDTLEQQLYKEIASFSLCLFLLAEKAFQDILDK